MPISAARLPAADGSGVTAPSKSLRSRWIRCNSSFKITSKQIITVYCNIIPQNGIDHNVDSLYFSIKNIYGIVLGFEKFIPYAQNIILRIPVTASNQAYAVIDYWCKGPETITISNLMIRRTEQGVFDWSYNPQTVKEKRNVRAIRIHLLTRTGEKAGTTASDPINVGEVTVTPSGEYTWRLYTESVETPNNGMF
jgi:hypothetical protein